MNTMLSQFSEMSRTSGRTHVPSAKYVDAADEDELCEEAGERCPICREQQSLSELSDHLTSCQRALEERDAFQRLQSQTERHLLMYLQSPQSVHAATAFAVQASRGRAASAEAVLRIFDIMLSEKTSDDRAAACQYALTEGAASMPGHWQPVAWRWVMDLFKGACTKGKVGDKYTAALSLATAAIKAAPEPYALQAGEDCFTEALCPAVEAFATGNITPLLCAADIGSLLVQRGKVKETRLVKLYADAFRQVPGALGHSMYCTLEAAELMPRGAAQKILSALGAGNDTDTAVFRVLLQKNKK